MHLLNAIWLNFSSFSLLLWSTPHDVPILVNNFLPFLNLTFQSFVFLAYQLKLSCQFVNILENHGILLFLLQEGFGNLLKIINPTFFLDLLEALLYFLHPFLIKVSDSNLFFVLMDQISNPKLNYWLSVWSFCCLLSHNISQSLSQILVIFQFFYILGVLNILFLVCLAYF